MAVEDGVGWLLADAEATRAAGAALAEVLRARGPAAPPLRIGLQGELGAGKTTLVGGLLATLGQKGPVRSPTYTLIEPYVLAGLELQHCDLYRLSSPQAVAELGLREFLEPGVVLLVEWPERAGAALGGWDVMLRLGYADDARRLQLESASAVGEPVVAALAGRLGRP